MTISLSPFYVLIGCFSCITVTAGSDELVINPMSIFVDPNLYRFCWDQIGILQNKTIHGQSSTSKPTTYIAFKENQYGKNTYCIESRTREQSYVIYLHMTKSLVPLKPVSFNIRFNLPLSPSFDLIRYRTVPRGIYFELNPDFVGITADPVCQVLLVGEFHRIKTILLFTISQSNVKFKSLSPGSSFTIYYTCKLEQLLEISTRFDVKKGVLRYTAQTYPLEPMIQMPLRRFIVLTWKLSVSLRYDVVIYEKSHDDVDVCVKLFRIFINKITTSSTSPRVLASNCNSDIPIEDLGYFLDLKSSFISVTLDMVKPLNLYKTYKLSIFWVDGYGSIQNNNVPLDPLPNENSGNINTKIFKYNLSSYNDILNEFTSQYQSVLSKNNENPYKKKTLDMPGYPYVEVRSSVIQPKLNGFNDTQSEAEVSKLYNICKKSKCSMNFFPYFYAIYYQYSTSVFSEIVQLPYPQDEAVRISNFKILPNDEENTFTVSWIIGESPHSTTPALFIVEVMNDENGICHSKYLIKCRTCNSIYVKNTIEASNSSIYDANCLEFNENGGNYDAVDHLITLTTYKMPKLTFFKVLISSYKFDLILKTEYSERMFLKKSENSTSKTNTYIYIFVGITSVTFLIGLTFFLYFRYKKNAPGDKGERKFSFAPAKNFEQVYDVDEEPKSFDEIYDEDET